MYVPSNLGLLAVVPASHAPADCQFFDFKPKRATVLFPQDFDVEQIPAPNPREIHRKHTTHIHYKPDIPSHIYHKPGPRKSLLPPCLDPTSAACNNNNSNNTTMTMNQPPEEPPVEKKAKKERGDSWKDIAVNLHKVRQTIVNTNAAAPASSSLKATESPPA